MEKNHVNEVMTDNILVYNDSILFSISQLLDLFKNPFTKQKIEEYHTSFLTFLNEKTNIHFYNYPAQFLSFSYNENYICDLSISFVGFISTINRMLGGDPIIIDSEIQKEKIEKLSRIRTESELKSEFPYYYDIMYKSQKEAAKLSQVISLEYMGAKNNPIQLKRIMKKYGAKDEKFFEILIETKKMFMNFDTFIKKSTEFFIKIVEFEDDIKEWTKNNPLSIKLTEKDLQSLFLYNLFLHFSTMFVNLRADNRVAAQREIMILEDLMDKYQELYRDNKTKIHIDTFLSADEKHSFDISYGNILAEYNTVLHEYPFLKRGVIPPSVDKSLSVEDNMNKIDDYISNLIDETITEEKEQGAIDATDEINKKVEQLEKEVLSTEITEDKRKINKIILKKVKMVLKDIEPKAIQKTKTGKVFRNYYVYYYPNGMVAVDKLDGYGALYIMPVHIYSEARYKKNLTEVKNIPGVIPINHKNKNWLEKARNYIENGTDGLTEEDIRKSSEVASVDFPYTIEKLEELEQAFAEAGNEQGVNETEKRIRITRKYKEIDTEIKVNREETPIEDDDESKETIEAINEISKELVSLTDSGKTEVEVFDYAKEKHGTLGRKGWVRALTKERARNEDGHICCELCGEATHISPYMFDSHHIILLSQGGVDNIYNTVCLCGWCHRKAHYEFLRNETEIQNKLFEIVRKHLEEETPQYLEEFDEMYLAYTGNSFSAPGGTNIKSL